MDGTEVNQESFEFYFVGVELIYDYWLVSILVCWFAYRFIYYNHNMYLGFDAEREKKSKQYEPPSIGTNPNSFKPFEIPQEQWDLFLIENELITGKSDTEKETLKQAELFPGTSQNDK